MLLLQVVFEAPPGVKMNLQRTYSSWSSDFLAGHTSSTAAAAARAGSSSTQPQQLAVPSELVPLRAQLLFLLAWFNAVVQERRNYVPFVSTLAVYITCLHMWLVSCTTHPSTNK
jgi:dynein heavy chain 2